MSTDECRLTGVNLNLELYLKISFWVVIRFGMYVFTFYFISISKRITFKYSFREGSNNMLTTKTAMFVKQVTLIIGKKN